MPRQGNTVESCIITNWKVKEGDLVTPETLVCEVETDKAAFEVPAGAAGTVLKLLFAAGDDVPVLKPIAVIGAPGEDWKAAVGSQESSHNLCLMKILKHIFRPGRGTLQKKKFCRCRCRAPVPAEGSSKGMW